MLQFRENLRNWLKSASKASGAETSKRTQNPASTDYFLSTIIRKLLDCLPARLTPHNIHSQWDTLIVLHVRDKTQFFFVTWPKCIPKNEDNKTVLTFSNNGFQSKRCHGASCPLCTVNSSDSCSAYLDTAGFRSKLKAGPTIILSFNGMLDQTESENSFLSHLKECFF